MDVVLLCPPLPPAAAGLSDDVVQSFLQTLGVIAAPGVAQDRVSVVVVHPQSGPADAAAGPAGALMRPPRRRGPLFVMSARVQAPFCFRWFLKWVVPFSADTACA